MGKMAFAEPPARGVEIDFARRHSRRNVSSTLPTIESLRQMNVSDLTKAVEG